MGDWGWVALGFGTAYVSIATYVLVLRERLARTRRRVEELP